MLPASQLCSPVLAHGMNPEGVPGLPLPEEGGGTKGDRLGPNPVSSHMEASVQPNAASQGRQETHTRGFSSTNTSGQSADQGGLASSHTPKEWKGSRYEGGSQCPLAPWQRGTLMKCPVACPCLCWPHNQPGLVLTSRRPPALNSDHQVPSWGHGWRYQPHVPHPRRL